MSRAAMILRSICVTAAVLVVAGGAVFFVRSKEMRSTANSFVEAVERGQIAQARLLLSESLRTGTEEEWLPNLLTQTGIADPASVKWEEPKSRNGYGELSGAITRRSGETVPITMMFVKE